MIVPMKKVSIIVLDKEKEAALQRLQSLGVMHLERKTVASSKLSKASTRFATLETAENILNGFAPKNKKAPEPVNFKRDLANQVVADFERRKVLQDYIFNHQRERSRFDKWGDFHPEDFAYLAKNGVNAYLYELPLDTYKTVVGDVPVITLAIDKKNNVVRMIAFAQIPNRYPYPMPERAISVIDERDRIRKAEITKIDNELASLYPLKYKLAEEKKSLMDAIEFETASASMDNITDINSVDNSVSCISGYVPVPDLGVVKRAASECNWAMCSSDPTMEDEVPTKIKNNKVVSLIDPVMNFLELIPGYWEKDISCWFLLFFTLFFAMIFGDAAYGTILFIIAIIAIAKTAKKGTPIALKFLLLLSISNIVWGTLVCSWFGLDTALIPQFLQNISLPLIVTTSADPAWVASYSANNFWIQSGLVSGYTNLETMGHAIDTHLMLFCFTIALVQLGIAHIVNIFAQIRSPKAIAEVGRLGLLFGMYFVILSLIVYNTGFEGVQTWQLYFIIGGFGLLFIFGNYEGSVLKSIISSCTNFITMVLNITNVFSDIMSYIRLWAVGLAAASIAGIINDFANPLFSRFAFFVFGLLLFGFGHGFNMVLNVLSVLVHGVRLNMLEFSSHVGLTWSGFSYKPFAKRYKI